MPRQKRASKRRGIDPTIFINSDGTYENLDGDDTYPNKILARAAWQHVRVQVWVHPWRWPDRPPDAAIAYDGFSDEVHKAHNEPERAEEYAAADLAAAAGALDRLTAGEREQIRPHVAEYLGYVVAYRDAIAAVEDRSDRGAIAHAWHTVAPRRTPR